MSLNLPNATELQIDEDVSYELETARNGPFSKLINSEWIYLQADYFGIDFTTTEDVVSLQYLTEDLITSNPKIVDPNQEDCFQNIALEMTGSEDQPLTLAKGSLLVGLTNGLYVPLAPNELYDYLVAMIPADENKITQLKNQNRKDLPWIKSNFDYEMVFGRLHFLEEQQLTDCEILKKEDILGIFYSLGYPIDYDKNSNPIYIDFDDQGLKSKLSQNLDDEIEIRPRGRLGMMEGTVRGDRAEVGFKKFNENCKVDSEPFHNRLVENFTLLISLVKDDLISPKLPRSYVQLVALQALEAENYQINTNILSNKIDNNICREERSFVDQVLLAINELSPSLAPFRQDKSNDGPQKANGPV